MNLKESLISFTYNFDELWDYDLEKLKEFGGVDRLGELLELIESLKTNEIFHRYATWDKICERNQEFRLDINKVHFLKSAKKSLGYQHMIPIFIPDITRRLIDLDGLVSVYAIIQISFNSYSGHHLLWEEDKTIKLSDIGAHLTFFVEDFDNLENVLPEYDGSFFKKLHHTYWENKRAKKLDSAIHTLMGDIYGKCKLDFQYSRGFHMAMFYLMGCNALKDGRDSISCDDVVIAYLTGFKIILNDIRPIVYGLYDEEKWKDERTWK